jgi:hypothetical protein
MKKDEESLTHGGLCLVKVVAEGPNTSPMKR